MAKLEICYNFSSDYINSNRFKDKIEGNNDISYNSFLSTSAVDLCYKINDREETLYLDMPDFIPLSVRGMRLIPNSFMVQDVNSQKVTITPTTSTQTTQEEIGTQVRSLGSRGNSNTSSMSTGGGGGY
tara:strand:- start:8 stop:391 length:384 start_codon:yes stop_codon:yes gene_type:complete